jgi:hypothetical protein
MEIRTRQRTGSRVFGVVFKIGDLIANRYRVIAHTIKRSMSTSQ